MSETATVTLRFGVFYLPRGLVLSTIERLDIAQTGMAGRLKVAGTRIAGTA